VNKEYLIAVRVNSEKGQTIEGNCYLTTDKPLDRETIEEIKRNYCRGLDAHPSNAVVYAIIPLV
jgi:hypothetical protein